MDERVALVLGASKGIGRQTFASLRKRGVHAIGVARTKEKLESLVREHGGESIAGNVRQQDSIRQFVSYARDVVSKHHAKALHVLYAPGMHEPASIVVDGHKRYSRASDFTDDDPQSEFYKGVPQFNYEVNVQGMRDVYFALHDAAVEDGFDLDFVFVSSQAAKNHEEWMEKGNPFYASHKREGEVFLYNMRNAHGRDLRALQFGLAGETMAKQLMHELEGIPEEQWIHVDEDPSKPLKSPDEVSLPLAVLSDDIASYMLRKDMSHWRPAYDSAYGDFVHEYTLSPSEARSLIE